MCTGANRGLYCYKRSTRILVQANRYLSGVCPKEKRKRVERTTIVSIASFLSQRYAVFLVVRQYRRFFPPPCLHRRRIHPPPSPFSSSIKSANFEFFLSRLKLLHLELRTLLSVSSESSSFFSFFHFDEITVRFCFVHFSIKHVSLRLGASVQLREGEKSSDNLDYFRARSIGDRNNTDLTFLFPFILVVWTISEKVENTIFI